MPVNMPPTYDRYGRMQYNPDYHPNQGSPWTTKDQQYLIDWYAKLGPDQVSLDLGRTIHTVMQRACKLRKQGLMRKPEKTIYHSRLRLDRNA